MNNNSNSNTNTNTNNNNTNTLRTEVVNNSLATSKERKESNVVDHGSSSNLISTTNDSTGMSKDFLRMVRDHDAMLRNMRQDIDKLN